jgi:actin-like ATPase involved in cell morphogenesis
MNPGWTLSIDFGTTNTVAATRLAGGEVRSVRLSSDTDQMPSCVLVDEQGIVVGPPAAMRALSAPARFEANPKRRMGDDTVRLGELTVPVAELVAAVLRAAATRAVATAGGRPPAQVVLTHPEAWARRRLDQLVRAAELAGLGPVRLLPEPVAAAMWYLRATRLPPGGRVAVFDFGGGTCDAAVLAAEPGSPHGFAVLAAGGEDQLGGEHIDRRLLDWVDTQLRASDRAELADRLEHPDEVGSWLTLRDQVRAAKHALSEYPSAHIAVRTMTGTASLLITVEEFERLIAQDVDRAVALAQRVLDEAGPPGVTGFYLTGGTSLVPLVQRRITALLGWAPATLDDPKLVVALGAAAGPPAGAGAPPTLVLPAPGLPGGHPGASGLAGRTGPGFGAVPAGAGGGRPARPSTRLVVAGVLAAVLLVAGSAAGLAALVSRSAAPAAPNPAAATASTTDAPAPTTTTPPTAPSTITLPTEMAATFPDLGPATGGGATDPSCSVRTPDGYPNAADGEKPIFVLDCEYSGQPGGVAYLQWANQAAGPRFLADLRATATPVEDFATWDLDGAGQGPYLATTDSSDTAKPFRLWASFDRRPCSFVVSGATLEQANALYTKITSALTPT